MSDVHGLYSEERDAVITLLQTHFESRERGQLSFEWVDSQSVSALERARPDLGPLQGVSPADALRLSFSTSASPIGDLDESQKRALYVRDVCAMLVREVHSVRRDSGFAVTRPALIAELNKLDLNSPEWPGDRIQSRGRRTSGTKEIGAMVIGNWELGDRIDEGGQGQIYFVTRVTPNENRNQYVMKRLKKDAHALGRLVHELEALGKLRHEGIVRLEDWSTDPSEPFYVMPYYSNRSLSSAKIESWTLADRFDCYEAVLRALGHAHEHGVTHRDLKPENILLQSDRSPVVADFGICFVNGQEHLTFTHEGVGARNYRPPEAEAGRCDNTTPTFDVYSLGKILYWMLSGVSLPRERYRESRYDLRATKDDPRYEVLYKFLDRAIVEDIPSRYPNGNGMLEEFRRARTQFERSINVPSQSLPARCVFCGLGRYVPLGQSDENGVTKSNAAYNELGWQPVGDPQRRILTCDACGNVQLFNIGRLRSQKGARNPWVREK